jgi:hypothetical protein
VEVQLQEFLISALDGINGQLPALLYLHAKTPSIYHLDTSVKRKKFCLSQESNPNHPAHSQSYWTILTLPHGSKSFARIMLKHVFKDYL